MSTHLSKFALRRNKGMLDNLLLESCNRPLRLYYLFQALRYWRLGPQESEESDSGFGRELQKQSKLPRSIQGISTPGILVRLGTTVHRRNSDSHIGFP